MDPADEQPVVLDDFKVHGGIERVRVTWPFWTRPGATTRTGTSASPWWR